MNILLKGEFPNFFIGLTDVPRYDIIWTEIGDLIDSLISAIFPGRKR